MNKLVNCLFIFLSLFYLSAQATNQYSLSRFKGNKIILFGEWKANDISSWNQVINSAGIYEHDFLLLDRANLSYSDSNYYGAKDIYSFERWLRLRYNLIGSTKWAALDAANNLIVCGTQPPSTKELEQMLDQRGIKSPLRQVRDFLRENPDHIDAKTDLLNEVRRRALHVMPPNPKENLDTEADLRTWAVLAAETDRVFGGLWMGIDLEFFSPLYETPERYSKLMRNVFNKHIRNVEAAIRLSPQNARLWNIWAWMASSLQEDYQWGTFIDSIEPFDFPTPLFMTCPPAPVSVWIVREARAKKDWDTVIRFAKNAREFRYHPSKDDLVVEWIPGHGNTSPDSGASQIIEGFPGKSAYAPHLEALLATGRIDEANGVYDEMIRLEGSNNALIAANVAEQLGMREIAGIWKKGELINKVPYFSSFQRGTPLFFVHARSEDGYLKNFREVLNKFSLISTSHYKEMRDMDTLGWKKGDDHRWALISADGIVLTQDTAIPSVDDMEVMLKRFDIESIMDKCRRYLATHTDQPGVNLDFASRLVLDNILALARSANQDEISWDEAAKHMQKVLTDYPETLIYVRGVVTIGASVRDSVQDTSMKPMAKPFLTHIESMLRNKPSSLGLWQQWFFWNEIENSERPIKNLVDQIKLSPLSATIGTLLPIPVMESYYQECKKNNDWPRLIALLEPVWERNYSRIVEAQIESPDKKAPNQRLGDNLVIPLMEAYLQDSRPNDANEIFNAWTGVGGKFNDITKIINLAKEKRQDRLAREWEGSR